MTTKPAAAQHLELWATGERTASELLEEAKGAHDANTAEARRLNTACQAKQQEVSEVSQQAKTDATLSTRKRELEHERNALIADLEGAIDACKHTERQVQHTEALCTLEQIQDQASDFHIPDAEEYAEALKAAQESIDTIAREFLNRAERWEKAAYETTKAILAARKAVGVGSAHGPVTVLGTEVDPKALIVKTAQGEKTYATNYKFLARQMTEKVYDRWSTAKQAAHWEATREERELREAEEKADRKRDLETRSALDWLSNRGR